MGKERDRESWRIPNDAGMEPKDRRPAAMNEFKNIAAAKRIDLENAVARCNVSCNFSRPRKKRPSKIGI